MDSNIDPSIAELDLFHVSSSLERTNKHNDDISGEDVDRLEEDHVSIPNVFRLNEYVADHHAATNNQHHEENDSTAAAALNMIQFNNFDDNHVENNVRDGHNNLGSQEHFGHFSDEQMLQEDTHSYDIDQSQASPAVKVVPYNPSEKTKRLGRPRKNLSNTLATPENSSSQNYNEAVVSKFRLDRLPLEGPGSRGGKLGARRSPRGRVTSGSIKKRKQQALLGSMISVDANGNRTSMVTLKTKLPISKDLSTDGTNGQNEVLKETETIENDIEIISPATIEEKLKDLKKKTEDRHKSSSKSSISVGIKSEALKGSSRKAQNLLPQTKGSIPTATIQKKNRPYRGSSRVTNTSRTTVRNNRHRSTRHLPGPLIGLYYDLYDDNILQAQQNIQASSEKLALGFPIVRSPYAKDISYIISYLNKFKEAIFGDKIVNLGPQDIESGLSLPPLRESSEIYDRYNGRSIETPNFDHSTDTSPIINKLFCRLLTLVLNRKKEVNPMSPSKAIAELKSISLYLGLPKKWRDDSGVLDKIKMQAGKDVEPVDENKVEILSDDYYTYTLPDAGVNPFKNSSEFESMGLHGIQNPMDRLLMLRCLMQWSLTTSDIIKNLITQSLQNQDISGEKETSYVSRSVLKGFKNTEEVRKECEIKINKKHTGTLNDVRESPENDIIAKYVDPTSDPLAHSMKLRLDELFVGDIGFNIGRFYLCRTADADNGGLASMKKMTYTWNNVNEIASSLPSKFKLYVQDVHQMLTESLAEVGVEFDENGNEFKNTPIDESIHWYEVASNAHELTEFVNFLALKLDLVETSEPISRLSKTSMIYKPVLNMYNYLASSIPLIANQEKLDTDSRSSRNKSVDYKYDYAANLDHDEDEDEIIMEHAEIDKADDDDYEEEEDGNDDQDYLD